MKKKSVIVIIILTIFMNIFYFIQVNNNLINSLLFDKTRVIFHFNEKSILDQEFLNKIIHFSQKNNVEISQYSFLSNNKIDIYSTKKNDYNEILLIPNLLFDKEIRVHNFNEIFNVGFKNLFYINTKNKNIISEFSKDFSEYGKLYDDLEKEDELKYISLKNFINYMDSSFLSIFPLFLFNFILIILFNYLNNKKKYLIYELWGYTKVQIYCIINKIFYKTLFVTILFCNLIMIGIVYLYNLTNVLSKLIPIMILLNLFMVCLLFFVSIILFSLSFINLNSKNEKNRLSNIRLIANLSKFCLLLVVVISFKNLFIEINTLKLNKESVSLWKNTENLYIMSGMYSPAYEDLALEDELNEKILKVYQDLSALNKVFIIQSLNFERSPIINTNNEDLDYNYKINVKNEKDLYSPYGKNIMVDKNYLKRNFIKTYYDKKNVLDKIDDNDDVLNVLIPQKFKKYEKTIKESYREWFYFQRVYIPNMYKKVRNKELSKKKIEELKINIIYIENDQSYFTYDSYSGDYRNNVKDPLVTVYTENIDNSVLASTLGVFMFLESENEYKALDEIKNITQKYNATELNSISSVYDKKGEKIIEIEDNLNRLILNIITLYLILITLTLVITYVYYKSYILKIIIKTLYGYDFISTYKDLVLSNLYMYILVFLLISIIYKKISIISIIIGSSMLWIDFIAIKFINKILIYKGEINLIKGELK